MNHPEDGGVSAVTAAAQLSELFHFPVKVPDLHYPLALCCFLAQAMFLCLIQFQVLIVGVAGTSARPRGQTPNLSLYL